MSRSATSADVADPDNDPNRLFLDLEAGVIINPEVRAFIAEHVPVDTRERTIPQTVPSTSDSTSVQILQSWYPILVDDHIARLLMEYNLMNRNQSRANAARLTRAMTNDRWHAFNGQSNFLLFTQQEMIDGQHKLTSVIQYYEHARANGIEPRPFLFTPIIGLSKSAFETLDHGHGRTSKDTVVVSEKNNRFSLRGVPAGEAATAFRLILQYSNLVLNLPDDNPLKLHAGVRSKIPNDCVPLIAETFPEVLDSLQTCYNMGCFRGRTSVVRTAVASVAHAIIAQAASTADADGFIRALGTGELLTADSPIHKLREQFFHYRSRQGGSKYEALDRLALCITAWNMVAAGRKAPKKGRITGLIVRSNRLVFPEPLPPSGAENRRRLVPTR